MYRIIPGKPEDREIDLPSSKSITHRLLILAALNNGHSNISNALISDDTQITRNALQSMGATITNDAGHIIVSNPIGDAISDQIFLGNSGSSARFLLPLGSYLDKTVRFYGTDRLHERPFFELINAINNLGSKIDATANTLPAITHPGKLRGGSLSFEKLPSSQVITALMMAGLKMSHNLRLQLPKLMPSLPYVLMTVKLMKRLRLNVEYHQNQIFVEAKQPEMEWMISVERDFSTSSYWIIFALIMGVKISLKGMNLPSLQGDEKILEIADEIGADIMLYTDRVEVTGKISKSFDVNCEETPDLVPALSVLALFCPQPCTLRKVKVLEYKESNRILAIQENIKQLGGKSTYQEGDLTIWPQKSYKGARINSFNDHRIAMSFAIAGLRIADIIIDNPDCVKKSYPGFWQDFTYWKPVNE